MTDQRRAMRDLVLSPQDASAGAMRRRRLMFAARYLGLTTALNVVWELAQLPLYTIWSEASPRRSVFAALHCSAGDLVIATSALAAAVLLAGRRWPQADYLRVAVVTVALGVAYTVLSEWINVELLGAWAYAAAMPRIPGTGTGLAPLAQWLAVPTASFLMVHHSLRNAEADAPIQPREAP